MTALAENRGVHQEAGPRALRVVHDGRPVDLAGAGSAAAAFLTALGLPLDTEGLSGTPARMASAYAELFAPRPFDLTTFSDHLAPRGVGVVVEAEHLCMTMRGVRAGGTSTVTSAVHGELREDGRSRAEFFTLARTGPMEPDLT